MRLNARRGSEQYQANALANRMVIGALAAGRRQAIQDGRLSVFEVRVPERVLDGKPLRVTRYRSHLFTASPYNRGGFDRLLWHWLPARASARMKSPP